MTNHVHLLVEPAKAGDVGRCMQCVGQRYGLAQSGEIEASSPVVLLHIEENL